MVRFIRSPQAKLSKSIALSIAGKYSAVPP